MNEIILDDINIDDHEHPQKLKILFVDDDPINMETFLVSFQDEYNIVTATTGEQALAIYNNEHDIAMVISDQRMPGMSGVELLTNILKINPESIRIIITGYTDVSDILDSINKGHIYQYILKPFDIMQLGLVLDHAARIWRLARSNKLLGEKIRKKNRLLEKANENLRVSENRLRHLSSVLITAIEDERRRISMELHDELGQSLAAAKLQIKLMENKFMTRLSDPEEMHHHCEGIRKLLNEIIENVRRLSNDLSPVIIDELGLDAALESLVINFNRYNDIRCVVDLKPIESYFSSDARRLIYRLFQEILNNVQRHSGADLLNIIIRARRQHVAIKIIDNGRGFDVEAVMHRPVVHKGAGLSAMIERANMLNGSAQVTSSPGAGTTVLLTLPIPQSSADTQGY